MGPRLPRRRSVGRVTRVPRTLPAVLTLLLVAPASAYAATTPATTPASTPASAPAAARAAVPQLPGGGRKVFARDRLLVAYYGFAHPTTTFVLGQTNPDRAARKMRTVGARLKQRGERVTPVYELVVTVADADPGADGDYAHDLLHSTVQDYIDAAHRNKALLVLDLQPGRASFLDVAKRWEWALADPWVGLGLDIEWRMRGDQVPGQDIGHVTAREIDETSAWLARLVRRERLPQKVLLFHQYRTGNVRGLGRVKRRPELATVQHVDAAGSPAAKEATYDALARPDRFTTGFMVFLDADTPRMTPRQIRRVDDAIRFVSYQ